jgi:hypothetical protein
VNAAATYFGSESDQLAKAQRDLDTHVTSGATGRCLTCGMPGPCQARENAVETWSRAVYRLPRRRPGITRPELIGARLVGGGSLLPKAS